MKEAVDVKNLPKGGPYSHANVIKDLIFVSGQSGQILGKEITFNEQFNNTMNKIESILSSCGSSMQNIVKISVYLSSSDYFKNMNDLFSKYFPEKPPARTTLVTGFVSSEIKVEVDVIAFR